jgi:hypothetical protein
MKKWFTLQVEIQMEEKDMNKALKSLDLNYMFSGFVEAIKDVDHTESQLRITRGRDEE